MSTKTFNLVSNFVCSSCVCAKTLLYITSNIKKQVETAVQKAPKQGWHTVTIDDNKCSVHLYISDIHTLGNIHAI